MKDNNKNPKTCQTVVFSVYVLWCQCTNQFYVGVTRQKRVYTRIRQHKKGKQFIDKEIRRVGWEGNWDWWTVEENIPSEQISEREQYWVAFFDCVYPKGYNKTCGGISKLTVSDDTREKIHQNALARDISGEKHPFYGKHHTEETKESIRQARLGKNLTEEHKANLSKSRMGEKNHFYGKHHSEEAKEKNRQAHLGKPSWNKGIPFSESTKAKMREKALAREAAKRAAKAVAEENLAATNSPPTSLSTLLDAVILQ